MIVILKMSGQPGEPIIDFGQGLEKVAPEISGWITATDTHDARRKAEAVGEHDLAQCLYSIEFPSPGRHELRCGLVGQNRYVMLVD